MSRGVTVCNERGCPTLVGTGANRCALHARPAWSGSTRRARLPKNWPTIRRRILKRDGYQCQWIRDDGTRCHAQATDVDHIEAGDDHDDRNLQALCNPHHLKKTGAEGARGRRRGGVAP